MCSAGDGETLLNLKNTEVSPSQSCNGVTTGLTVFFMGTHRQPAGNLQISFMVNRKRQHNKEL